MSEILKIAVQKSGRLSENTLQLLKDCGIKVSSVANRLKEKAANFPAEVLFLRDDDIPEYVQDGVADIGIVGENIVTEQGKNINETEKLGFGKCRLSLAVEKNAVCDSLSFFNGKRIATSYPVILGNFLKKNRINATIHEISGSVEIAPGIGLAEGICDIVSSGSTLFSNGLKEVETVFHSEAVLISGKNLNAEKKKILDKLIFRIRSVNNAKNNKYILLNTPDEKLAEIISILPGMKSPTVLPLAEKGWSSVHSVISDEQFWEVIDQLKQAGAQGILIVPIEKMVV
ncbi:MAG: ATP phosphoribosyltransferase [Bacteroidota bacterium]